MKKRILAAVLGIAAVMAVSACGKSEKEQAKEYYQEELGLTEEEAEEIADFVYSEETTPTEAPEEAVPEENELEHFPLSSEWKDYSISDGVVQIDDTIYYKGMTAEEFMKRVEQSKAGYIYEYNPDKLMTGGDNEIIEFYRDNTLWFTIMVYNGFFCKGSAHMSQCPVKEIIIQDAAYDYCYFIDGHSYEEIMQMTYDDVKELADTVFADERFREADKVSTKCVYPDLYTEEELEKNVNKITNYCTISETSGKRKDQDALYIQYRTPRLTRPELMIEDPNYKGEKNDIENDVVWHSESYSFIFDSNTGELIDFKMYIPLNA